MTLDVARMSNNNKQIKQTALSHSWGVVVNNTSSPDMTLDVARTKINNKQTIITHWSNCG